MHLSLDQVSHIANLARLRLTDDEQAHYGAQISAILDYVDQLQLVDTTDIEPTTQVTGLTNVTREDIVGDSALAPALVDCAPTHHDSYIVIPKVLNKD